MSKTNSIYIDNNNKIDSDELKNILNLQLDEFFVDPSNSDKIPPLFIWGHPGIGKSSIVKKICEERGIEFHDVRLCQIESVDIRGIPVPNKETHQTDWYVNGSWPRDPNGKGIIFLDELSAADRSVQVASYELVLDRRLGKLYTVPPGYMIVAAGNTSADRAIVSTMSSALANRFMHVELTEDAEKWCSWARNNNVHPSVIGFIQYRNSMLFSMDNQNLERGWPSPRSWERVSKICKYCKDKTTLRKMVYGLVGAGAGVEFMAFYELNKSFDNVLEAMRDPNYKLEIPKKADEIYAMVSSMVYVLWRGDTEEETDLRVSGFLRICKNLTSDFATMAVTSAYDSDNEKVHTYRVKKIYHNKYWDEWIKLHKDALKKYMKTFNS